MKDNELYVASEFTDNRYLVVIIGNRFSNPIKLTEETKIRARATMTKPCNWELALEEAESLRNQED
jgi:hypothetical protein